MLVLSRKAEQKITIGADVVVTVLSIKGNSVQIGIEAPDKVRILRGELLNNELATTGSFQQLGSCAESDQRHRLAACGLESQATLS
jgi:carbon storage regulator CsrA